MTQETIRDLFGFAITGERIMQDYYYGLAGKFGHLAEISNFWKDLAMDEARHLAALAESQKSIGEDILSSLAEPAMTENMKNYLKFSAADMLNSVNNLDDAYELAHEMEYSEINSIFKFLTTNFISSPEKQRDAVYLIDSHLAKLMDFSKNFGNVQWRKGICVADSH